MFKSSPSVPVTPSLISEISWGGGATLFTWCPDFYVFFPSSCPTPQSW